MMTTARDYSVSFKGRHHRRTALAEGRVHSFYVPSRTMVWRTGYIAGTHERVYFAGEHLADEQGFMEGAVVTGQDVAAKVQKASTSSLSHRSPHQAIVSYS